MRSPARPLLALAFAATLAACAAPRYLGPSIPELQGGSPRCRVGSGRSNPLVTEWAASEKANLEALLRRGAVAVEYQGCSMRVLTQCRIGGGYVWQRTTLATDVVEIKDEDELYAKLPLGAASLEGELKRSGQLNVNTWVSGQLRLEGLSVGEVPSSGECARATHVIGGLAVGAFSLDGSGSANADAKLGVKLFSAGGKSDRSAGIKRGAGDSQSCDQSTDAAPHPSCASPIQVFLWPIPGRASEEGPPGTVRVDLISTTGVRWDVYYDDQVVCTTPCSRWLDPARPVMLRTRDEGLISLPPDRIQLRDLGPAANGGAVQLLARPTSYAEQVTGIAITGTAGGVSLMALMLGGLGCTSMYQSREGSGLCRGSLTTSAIAALATIPGIWLILDSRPKAEIVPGGAAPNRAFTVQVGPGFVAGRF